MTDWLITSSIFAL